MLWACELKPRSWWNDDFNVVEMCVKLLHALGVWLRDAQCTHYFVRNCNLFDHLDKSGSHQLTAVTLMSVTVESLSKWFVHNYIRKCHESCVECCTFYDNFYDPRLFDDVSSNAKLQKAVTELVCWRHTIRSSLKLANFARAQLHVVKFMFSVFRSVRSCSYFVSVLEKIDHDLLAFFIAVAFLYVAYNAARRSLADGLVNMLATICRIARSKKLSSTDEVSKKYFESLRRFLRYARRQQTMSAHHLDTSKLAQLLQQSLQLVVVRYLEAKDFFLRFLQTLIRCTRTDVATINAVLRCLPTQKVRTPMSDVHLMQTLFMFPLFTQ